MKDPEIEANPDRVNTGTFYLDGALNLHCGALSVVVESPSHGFSRKNNVGEVPYIHRKPPRNYLLTISEQMLR